MIANQFLPTGWVERVVRLAIGVTPLDAVDGADRLLGVELAFERVPRPHPVVAGAGDPGDYSVGIDLPVGDPGRTGRFAITFDRANLLSPVPVRLYDRYRRFVPRRLRLPMLTEVQVIAEERAHEATPFPPVTSRVFHPSLFPGAAYGVQAGVTAVRGRVRHVDGSPARWTRIHATHATLGTDLGWAHGDDRGEFLLVLISSQAQLLAGLSSTVDVAISVAARPRPVALDSPAGSVADPLSDLKIEDLPVPGAVDVVSDGRGVPADFTATTNATLTCIKGRVTRPPAPFVVP